jgi:hypothetical protein
MENAYINVGDSVLAKVTVAYPSFCFRLEGVQIEQKQTFIRAEIIARAPLEQACPERQKKDEIDIIVPGLEEGAYTLQIAQKEGGWIDKAIRVIRAEGQSNLTVEKTVGTHVESWLIFDDGVVYYKEEEGDVQFKKISDEKAYDKLIKYMDHKKFFRLPDEDIPVEAEEGEFLSVYKLTFKSADEDLGTKVVTYSFHEKKSNSYIRKKIHPNLMDVLNSM